MAFTDDEVLLLLDLDLDLDLGDERPVRWRRLGTVAWWATVVLGAVVATLLLHAGYGLIPPRFGG